MPWSKYFPKQDEDSSSDSAYDELQMYRQKKGSSSKMDDASMNPTSNHIAKQAFADRVKVQNNHIAK